MLTYNARDLLKLNNDELWGLPDGKIKLIFDDGEIETTTRETIFSVHLWEFHKRYPVTPMLIHHHINNRRLGNRTHAEILEKAQFDCYEACKGSVHIETLSKIAYETVNDVYNIFTYKLEAYVSSISVFDFVDVVIYPKIKAIKEKILPNQGSIDNAYKSINAILRDPNELVGNAIAKAAKSGLVSIDQIDQCIGPRGYIADIDSHIFRNPIMDGYIEGITSLHDNMIESRSASKALMFTKDPLKAVEYFNRQIQMICATFKDVHEGDCGSQKYLRFKVRAADLESCVGKYYKTDTGIARVKSSDRHLIGQEVNFRSVLYCQHKDNYGCCSTCFGDLFLSIPEDTNQGHVSSTILGEKASQNVMSTKHLDGSSKVDTIELNDYEQLYICVDSNDANKLRLSPELKGKRLLIRVSAKEANGLSVLNYTSNPASLTPHRVSQLVEVTIAVENNGVFEEAIIPVSIGNRLSCFTSEMLHYIKTAGWQITPDGNYEIDLKDWYNDAPMFALPMKHLNMVDHMRSVEAMIKSPRKVTKTKNKNNQGIEEDTAGIFYELYKLVSTKIRFNIAHLEVIMKATMISSIAEKNFDIPFDADSGDFGYYSSTMKMRSLSALMAYQGHVAGLLDPNSFIVKKRMTHPFDPLLMG